MICLGWCFGQKPTPVPQQQRSLSSLIRTFSWPQSNTTSKWITFCARCVFSNLQTTTTQVKGWIRNELYLYIICIHYVYIWCINTCTWKVVGHLDLSIFYYPFQSGPHETLTQKPRGFHCRSRFRGANCGGFGWSRIFLWCHCLFLGHLVMWMFPKIVGFPPKSSILIGFSIIFTIHFGVPICLEPPILMQVEVSFVFR